MPTGDDLVGLGMNPTLASSLGNSPHALTTTGTAQGTAAAILTTNTEFVTAGSQTGGILPSTAKLGTLYFINVQSATTGVAYVPSGHTLNATLNGSLSIAQNKAAIMWQYKANNWTYILTA